MSVEDLPVLLVAPDARRRRQLRSVLRSAAPLVVCADVVPDDTSFSAIVLDEIGLCESASRSLRVQIARAGTTPVVLLPASSTSNELIEWLEGPASVHVLQPDAVQQHNDLYVTIRKILRGTLFGIEQYFAWGARVTMQTIRDSKDKLDAIRASRLFAESTKTHPRIASLVESVTDEFVTNALFSAPVTDGVFRFRSMKRSQHISLLPHEEVALTFCTDGRRIGLSVTDPFGTLTADTVRTRISRGLRRENQTWDNSTGGAGLGLYCAFESLSHLVVNVEHRVRTEVIGIFHLRDSYKEFARAGKSYNVFVAGAS
jgi:hypothetical protein